MNDFPKEIYTRTNLQHIREFILHGGELDKASDEPYQVRLDKGCEPIINRLKRIYPNEDKLDNAISDLGHALSTYQDVSVEIGMKLGARLLYQLLFSDEEVNAKLK